MRHGDRESGTGIQTFSYGLKQLFKRGTRLKRSQSSRASRHARNHRPSVFPSDLLLFCTRAQTDTKAYYFSAKTAKLASPISWRSKILPRALSHMTSLAISLSTSKPVRVLQLQHKESIEEFVQRRASRTIVRGYKRQRQLRAAQNAVWLDATAWRSSISDLSERIYASLPSQEDIVFTISCGFRKRSSSDGAQRHTWHQGPALKEGTSADGGTKSGVHEEWM